MSSASYSSSQRGGGSGETGRMRAAIVAQIDSWVQNANWADPERAERMLDKLHEAPERFVSPNPNTCGSHKEEASRIYEELKEEFGLRTEREAVKEARTYEDMAEAHYDRKDREESDESDETIDLADPTDESDADATEQAVESEPVQGADDKLVRDAIESVESGESSASRPANATEPEETEASDEATGDGSILRDLAIVVGQRVGREARRSARLAWVGLQALAPILLAWMLTGVRLSAYGAGRLTVLTAQTAAFAAVLSIKMIIATIGLIVTVAVAFVQGFAAAV